MRAAWLLCEGNVLASLEVAESLLDRSKGLLGRSDYEGAMLFPRTRAIHSFGMRFALDVAFLDGDLVVIDSLRLAPMRAPLPRLGTRNVVEARAGSFARWSLEVGQRLEIRETV